MPSISPLTACKTLHCSAPSITSTQKKKQPTNQPATLRTPASIIACFAHVIKLVKPSVPEPKKNAYLCIKVKDMSVVVTSRHTRKTSVSLYSTVPRYTITTLLLSGALASTGGAWRLLRCGLCFLLATRYVSDGLICRRTRKRTGLSNRLTTFTSLACHMLQQ